MPGERSCVSVEYQGGCAEIRDDFICVVVLLNDDCPEMGDKTNCHKPLEHWSEPLWPSDAAEIDKIVQCTVA